MKGSAVLPGIAQMGLGLARCHWILTTRMVKCDSTYWGRLSAALSAVCFNCICSDGNAADFSTLKCIHGMQHLLICLTRMISAAGARRHSYRTS